MGCCPVERRKLVRHETLDLATGASKPVSEEWATEACNIPLFGDRARGICSGCASGWTHEHNYPTDNGKAAIAAASTPAAIARGQATIEREPRMKLADGSLAPVTYEVRLPDGWRFDDGTHAKVCSSHAEATKELASPIEPCPADCECR